MTGVIKDVPSHSHIKFDFLIPSTLGQPSWPSDWSRNRLHTYFKLTSTSDMNEVELKVQDLIARHGQSDIEATYQIEPLTSIHLSEARLDELSPKGNQQQIKILSIIALFVLLIAGINYINLTTAKSANRSKEIGVRKVIGSPRKNIINQFLIESLFISALAVVLALIITGVSLPYFNNLIGTEFTVVTEDVVVTLGVVIAWVLVFGLAAGLYPAFYLSSFKPIKAFSKHVRVNASWFNLRKVLVLVQFGLSGFLIISLLVVQKQIDFLQSKSLGFDKDQVIIIDNFRKVPGRDKNRVVRSVLRNLMGVKDVGAFNEMVGLSNYSSETQMSLKGADNQKVFYGLMLDITSYKRSTFHFWKGAISRTSMNQVIRVIKSS